MDELKARVQAQGQELKLLSAQVSQLDKLLRGAQPLAKPFTCETFSPGRSDTSLGSCRSWPTTNEDLLEEEKQAHLQEIGEVCSALVGMRAIAANIAKMSLAYSKDEDSYSPCCEKSHALKAVLRELKDDFREQFAELDLKLSGKLDRLLAFGNRLETLLPKEALKRAAKADAGQDLPEEEDGDLSPAASYHSMRFRVACEVSGHSRASGHNPQAPPRQLTVPVATEAAAPTPFWTGRGVFAGRYEQVHTLGACTLVSPLQSARNVRSVRSVRSVTPTPVACTVVRSSSANLPCDAKRTSSAAVIMTSSRYPQIQKAAYHQTYTIVGTD